MQIQEDFGGLPTSALASRGLGVYQLIPDYRDRCPVCAGAGCVVRHGLYFRDAVGVDGSVDRLPIPRFRCQRRGPCESGPKTFSVLPACLVPRRRYSLALMLRILDLVATRPSIAAVLDELAAGDRSASEILLIDGVAVYRLLRLFARAYGRLERLSRRPLPEGRERLRARALAAARILAGESAPSTPGDRDRAWRF